MNFLLIRTTCAAVGMLPPLLRYIAAARASEADERKSIVEILGGTSVKFSFSNYENYAGLTA